jgi:hypothetical protein
MKKLVVLAFVVIATLASAQSTTPNTIIMETPDGQMVGTATIWGNQATYRNAKGELTGSSVIKDGKITYFDVNGKITGTAVVNGKVTTNYDTEGKITGTNTVEDDGTTTIRNAAGEITSKTKRK